MMHGMVQNAQEATTTSPSTAVRDMNRSAIRVQCVIKLLSTPIAK